MAVDRLQVVIHPEDRPLCDAALKGLCDARLLPPTDGGATRAASVLKGLEALVPSRPGRVLIHDAARPFVPAEVITAIIAALDDAPGAFAALPVVDALWKGEDRRATAPVARDGLWRAQTPQGFHFNEILAAHRAYKGEAADDVAVACASGLEVRIVPVIRIELQDNHERDLARAQADVADTAEPVAAPYIAATAAR